MKVRLLKPWGSYSPGHTFSAMSESTADLLVSRKIAEILPELETAARASAIGPRNEVRGETAMRAIPGQPRRRGRPPKVR